MSTKTRYIVNESGEVLEEIKGGRVLTSSQVLYLAETQKLEIPFVKINPLVIKDLKNIANTITLLDYIDFKTNILRYKNGRLIRKIKDVGKIFSGNEKVAYRKANELIKDEVIMKVKEENITYFIFNPYIAYRGKRISRKAVEHFKNSRWRAYVDED